MAKRSGSSRRWLQRHVRDPYVRAAARSGLGSRAHFKLEQLDRRFALLRPGMRVLELGAAPGGWTRYLAQRLAPGELVAVDRRPMEVPPEVTFLQLDIHADEYLQHLDRRFAERGVDLVLSDMAPNITGIGPADQAAMMALVDLATESAARWLNRGGHLVVKMMQGQGVDAWRAARRLEYERVQLAKPEASRTQSREVYGVALRRA